MLRVVLIVPTTVDPATSLSVPLDPSVIVFAPVVIGPLLHQFSDCRPERDEVAVAAECSTGDLVAHLVASIKMAATPGQERLIRHRRHSQPGAAQCEMAPGERAAALPVDVRCGAIAG